MEIYWRNILKSDLCKYLSIEEKNVKKNDIEKIAQEKIDSSDIEKKKFFSMFEKETALSPYFLEKTLNCTKAERLKWTKEGRLKVVDYVEVQKYGKKISCPMYSFYQAVFKINKNILKEWRSKKIVKNKVVSIEKAKKTKRINDKKRQFILDGVKKEFKKWYIKDCVLAHTFQLSYWTVWLSYLIEKYDNKRKNRKEILKDLYKRKNKSMILLNKTPYSNLSVLKYFYYDRYGGICGHDYIYFLNMKSNKIPHVEFSFFAPYSLQMLRDNFPPKDKLRIIKYKKIGGIEDSACIDFIVDDETVCTKSFILKELEKSYASLEYVLQK